MTPYQQIEAKYAANPREEPFENYVRHHLRHGFVFSTPEYFTMGRPVDRHAPESEILDSRVMFPRERCSAWHIFAASGNMTRMWRSLPYPLGWMCWSRLHDPVNGLVFVESERLIRLCPPDLQQ